MQNFHQTGMGKTFFERTVPELVEQLKRLNENIERAWKQDEELRDKDKEHTKVAQKDW